MRLGWIVALLALTVPTKTPPITLPVCAYIQSDMNTYQKQAVHRSLKLAKNAWSEQNLQLEHAQDGECTKINYVTADKIDWSMASSEGVYIRVRENKPTSTEIARIAEAALHEIGHSRGLMHPQSVNSLTSSADIMAWGEAASQAQNFLVR